MSREERETRNARRRPPRVLARRDASRGSWVARGASTDARACQAGSASRLVSDRTVSVEEARVTVETVLPPVLRKVRASVGKRTVTRVVVEVSIMSIVRAGRRARAQARGQACRRRASVRRARACDETYGIGTVVVSSSRPTRSRTRRGETPDIPSERLVRHSRARARASAPARTRKRQPRPHRKKTLGKKSTGTCSAARRRDRVESRT